MEKIPSSKLISDLPADTDAFGSHSRIANAICNLITTEDGGKTVGLEGDWGSGKSTIINLLEKKLKDNQQINIIMYDAWSHQGDPLRRTFLETLMTNLENSEWFKKDFFQNYRDTLLQRKKTTTNDIVPRVGILATIVVVIFAIILPYSLRLFSVVASDLTNFRLLDISQFLASSSPELKDYFYLSIFPILTVIFLLILAVLISLFTKNTKWLAIITQQNTTTTTSEAIETPDPTSVEFEQMFDKIIGTSLSQNKKRQLVIVLDNLDRVNTEDALSILASLQTFLQHSQGHKPQWFEQLWVIIAYDRRAFERLWIQSEGNKIAIGFIDKTFQIRFEVPKLLLANWRQYMNVLLNEAFPDISDKQEFERAVRIYTNYQNNLEGSPSPTPREIKLFVNQIGALYRQWGKEFTLAQITYFVTLRMEHDPEQIANSLIQNKIPPREFLTMLGNEPRPRIAAMLYSSEISDAQQILLRGRLENAITTRNVETIKDLSQSTGFWDVLSTVDFDDWSHEETYKLANTAYVLSENNLLKDKTQFRVKSVIEGIQRASNKVKIWDNFSKDIAEGISRIIELDPQQYTINSAIAAASSVILEGDEDVVFNWVDGIVLLLGRWAAPRTVIDKIHIPSDEKGVVLALSRLFDSGSSYLHSHQPTLESDKITKYIIARIDDNSFSIHEYNTILLLQKFGGYANELKQIVDHCFAALNGVSIQSAQEVKYLLKIGWVLCSDENDIANKFDTLVNVQNSLLHYIVKFENDVVMVAWCLFVTLQFADSLRLNQRNGQGQQGLNKVNEILSTPDKYDDIMKQYIDIVASCDCFSETIEMALVNKYPTVWHSTYIRNAFSLEPNLFDIPILRKAWKYILESVEKDLLHQISTYIENVYSISSALLNSEFDINESGLYSVVLSVSEGETQRDFAKWCIHNLKEVQTSSWKNIFSNETYTIDLLIQLIQNNYPPKLEISYKDALFEHAALMMDSRIAPKKYVKQWNLLPHALNEDYQNNLKRNLLKEMGSKDGQITDLFFDVYGNYLVDLGAMKSYEGIVTDVFQSLLLSNNERSIRWLAQAVQNTGRSLSGFKPRSEVTEFQARLEESLKTHPQNSVYPYIKKIADKVIYKKDVE